MTTPNPKDIQTIDTIAKAMPTPKTNPLAKPVRILLTDRINNMLCNVVIGTPDSINASAVVPIVYDGFYHQPQGIRMLAATQSISAFVERFGEVGVQVMATNFLSWCLMRSNPESFKFLGAKLGKTYRPRGSDVAASKPDDFMTHSISLNNPTNDWEAAFGGETMELLAAQDYGMAVPALMETHNHRLVDDYDETMDSFARNEMFIAEATKAKPEHLDLVEEADFHALSKGQGYALMSVRRGGVDRRDFVRLKPMKTIDPAWFTKAA